MRSLIVVLFVTVLALGHGAHYSALESEKQARVFENEIRGLLACVQKSLNDGMPEVGLPPLNPLKVDEISLELGTLAPELLSGHVKLNNVYLNGVAQWKFDKLKTAAVIFPPGFKADLKLSNPSIVLNSDYEFDITVQGKPVNGKGTISLEIANLSFDGNVKVSLSSGIKDFNVVVDVDKTDLKITGLFGDDEFSKLISDEVTNNVPNFIKENKDEISKAIKDIVMKLVSKPSSYSVEIGDQTIDINAILTEIKKRCFKI